MTVLCVVCGRPESDWKIHPQRRCGWTWACLLHPNKHHCFRSPNAEALDLEMKAQLKKVDDLLREGYEAFVSSKYKSSAGKRAGEFRNPTGNGQSKNRAELPAPKAEDTLSEKKTTVAYIGTVPGHGHQVIDGDNELCFYPCADPKCPLAPKVEDTKP